LPLVRFWAGEPVEEADIERECAAAEQRVRWRLRHGSARTADAVLARQGEAYAVAGSPFGPLEAGEAALVGDGVELLGASEQPGAIAAGLFGDPAGGAAR